MKSDDLYFTILKELMLGPGHGYDLFMQLREMHEIKNPSELYKLLRSMKQDGIIQVALTEKVNGREREILEITPSGIEMYYKRLFDASKAFLNLISETAIRRLGEGFAQQLHSELANIFKVSERVYLDLTIPIEQQLLIVNQIHRYFEKSPVFYIKVNPEHTKSHALNRAPAGVQFLDENMLLKPQSIDLLLMMRAFSPTGDAETSTFSLLKPTGILVAATLRENLRDVTPFILRGIGNLFKDLFDEQVSSNLMALFSELLYSRLFYSDFVSNKNIEETLARHFKSVVPVNLHQAANKPLFDAFVAKEPV